VDGGIPIRDQGPDELRELIADFQQRTTAHERMWAWQVEERLGKEPMLEVLDEVSPRWRDIRKKRLEKILGEGPVDLGVLPRDKLVELLEGIAINWLAQDGVWFQGVEFKHGMALAKECNDACWAEFSPFEAMSIRFLLGISDEPGLGGLKTALGYRLYAVINEQSIHDDGEDAFVFRMDRCRVQTARKRKGLDDYPCKSGGIVEYTTFARTIDPRIRTECIACPPDEHPEDWFCAWRFVL